MQAPPPPPPPGYGPPPAPPPGDYPPPPPPGGAYPPAPPQSQWTGYSPYAPQASYGGFWIRLVAVIIDGIIVTIPIFVIAFLSGVFLGIGAVATGNTSDQSISNASGGVSAVVYVIGLLIGFGYFVYFWGIGGTPAMRLLKLRVVDATSGTPIGFGRAILRYVGYILSVLVCYIGLIWAAFDGRKQGWHDKIAGTVVLQG